MSAPDSQTKYYIIGSRGFIGGNLKKYLLSKQNFVYDDVCVDITNQDHIDELIQRIIQKENIDVIFNCAGISDYQSCEKEPIKAFEVNSFGPLNLLNSINKYSPATKLINLGSIKEFNSLSWYSQTKRLAREIVSYYRDEKGLWANQLYLPQIVGPGQSDKFIVGKIIKFIKNLKTNSKSSLKLGNIESELKLLYIENACELIIKSSNYKNPEDYWLDGINITVKNFLIKCFESGGFTNWEDFIEIDENLFRAPDLENYIEFVSMKLKSRDTIDNILTKLFNE